MMEEYTTENENQESSTDRTKRWLQDNLRIIVSIVIVAVIAGGIYSYSKRSNAPLVTDETSSTETVKENESGVEIAAESETQKEDGSATEKETANETPAASPEKETVTSESTSKETDSSFVETAVKGDGVTHLARKALADYLEKNPDSALTKEHKVYIEDYLRKNAGFRGSVQVGTEISFSKNLIQQSIEQSKKLNESQLKNLQKYSSRVQSIS